MNDKKKLLVEYITFETDQSVLRESTENPNKPFIVRGIVQRKGAKNQNGRVYPDGVLEREVDKYVNTLIKERRALGELDHPDCVSCCDIMTYEGWKDIKSVVVGELIPTLNTVTNIIEYNPIERVINEPYKGKMISIKGRNIDILVTPNHRFILNSRVEVIEKTAQEIFETSKKVNNTHWSIPIIAENWNGKNYDTFVIPSVVIDSYNNEKYRNRCDTDLILDASSWFSFLGFYLAE